MKKIQMLLAVFAVLSILLASCTPAATPTQVVVPATPPTAVPPADTVAPQPQPTTPPAEPTAAPVKMTFAMVTDQAGLGDQGFNDAAWEGMQKLKTDFGADVKVVESREQSQYVPNFSTLAEQKVDYIVGIGFLLTDAVKEVAPQFPDSHFAIVDSVVDEPNVASLVFKEHEGSFLVGAIAGMYTKTNKVGFVGGIESDLLKKFESGYRAGVKTTNPNAEVLVSYTGTFADPAKGKEMANAQYDQKADVIYEVAGLSGTGVIAAAKDRNLYAISVDRDKNYLAPENVISGMIKRVDTAVFEAGKMVADGNFKGGVYEYGVKEGGIDIAPSTAKMIPADMLKVATDLKQMIIDGKVSPPKTLDELKAFTPPTVTVPAK